MTNNKLKVCYFGTYRATYSRNQIMINALRTVDVEVIECHVPLWHGIEDRVNVASGRWASWGFVKRVLSTYSRLLKKYASLAKNYDVMVLGYPGQLDVFLARLLTWWHRKPLALDLFMSIYLVASERGLVDRSPISGWLLRQIEKIGCRLPDRLIIDTDSYVEWHHKTHNLSPSRFCLVPTGADDRLFVPQTPQANSNGQFTVLYYGTFIPNHGVPTIIQAASILKDKLKDKPKDKPKDEPHIHFQLIGEGPTKAKAEALVKQHNLTNVTFTGWMEKDELIQQIANANICLGVFGTTPQSLMTVQNKIYECLAMKKPVITGQAAAIDKALTHGEHVYLCDRKNPNSLADAIIYLKNNPQIAHSLAENGYQHYHANFNLYHNGLRYANHLRQLQRS